MSEINGVSDGFILCPLIVKVDDDSMYMQFQGEEDISASAFLDEGGWVVTLYDKEEENESGFYGKREAFCMLVQHVYAELFKEYIQ